MNLLQLLEDHGQVLVNRVTGEVELRPNHLFLVGFDSRDSTAHSLRFMGSVSERFRLRPVTASIPVCRSSVQNRPHGERPD